MLIFTLFLIECEFEAIRRCDDEFVYLIRAADPATGDNQQGMLCKAFQVIIAYK